MSFRQKNVGATYQRCMQFCFKEQIGRNLKVYVDNIIIKSRRRCRLISNLEETFSNLWCFNINLNPGKCTFGVLWGKLLGYIITECYIEANTDEILATARIGPIKNIKDIQ
jgi:hypothetical protein